MARRAGVDADARRPRRGRRATCRCSPTCSRSGDQLMEDFYYAGGLPALMTRIARRTCRSTSSPSTAARCGENLDGRAGARRRRDPPAANARSAPSARAGRAARQPRARRRGHQALARPAPALLQPPRPRAGVRRPRRRCTAAHAPTRRSTCDENTVLVLRNAGPVGAPGHARVGQPADPEEAARSRACATWCASPTRA